MNHRRLIVAYDENRAIGRNGDLPWAGRLPADMHHFRRLTEGASVIMGRTTFESLPEASRPLRNRENIVLSMTQKALEGVIVVQSLEEAFERATHEPFIIGGGRIYQEALPHVDQIDATEIRTRIEGADTFFPEIFSDEWRVASREDHAADAKNHFDYTFTTYICQRK